MFLKQQKNNKKDTFFSVPMHPEHQKHVNFFFNESY